MSLVNTSRATRKTSSPRIQVLRRTARPAASIASGLPEVTGCAAAVIDRSRRQTRRRPPREGAVGAKTQPPPRPPHLPGRLARRLGDGLLGKFGVRLEVVGGA